NDASFGTSSTPTAPWGGVWRCPPNRGRLRSTSTMDALAQVWEVSPAYAGIDLRPRRSFAGGESFPRIRGDRPALRWTTLSLTTFPPHTRGSTVGFCLGSLHET